MVSILDKLSSARGKRDHEPNHQVAAMCVKRPELLAEIATGFNSESAPLRFDCAEVFAETAKVAPKIVAPHIELMLQLLNDETNNVRWEILIGISAVAPLVAEKIHTKRELLLHMAQTGSVIVKDGAISSLAKVAGASPEYRKELFPRLLGFLEACIPRDIARYGEYLAEAVASDPGAKAQLACLLEKRLPDCNKSGAARVRKLLKRLGS